MKLLTSLFSELFNSSVLRLWAVQSKLDLLSIVTFLPTSRYLNLQQERSQQLVGED